MNKKKRVGLLIPFFWFYILLICLSAYAKDKVNLDLIGRWGHTSSINCTEILLDNAHSYAYYGTTRGLLISEVTDPHIVKEDSFLEIGQVYDIAFYNPAYDSNKYAVLATEKGIRFLSVHNPTDPTFAGSYDTEG